MKRTLILLCCLSMLLSTLTGCGLFKKDQPDDGVGSDSEVDTQGDETDADGFVLDSIPDDIKYNGEDIRIMAWNNAGAVVKDFNVDTSKGDKVAQKTYNRNTMVEDRLNVKLVFYTDLRGDNDKRYEYVQSVTKNIRAGEKYDMISCYSQSAADFALEGYTVDLMEYGDIIELRKPWWSNNMVEGSRINDKLYFTSGAISATSILQTMALAVNMEKVYGVYEDPRELVKSGKWTMEVFYEMCKGQGMDMTGSASGKDKTDDFGFVAQDRMIGDAFFCSNGLKYLVTDDSGKLVLDEEFVKLGGKTETLLNDLSEKFESDKDYYYPKKGESALDNFIAKKSLFCGLFLESVLAYRNKMNFNFGYVPFPKADEGQGEYYSVTGFPFTMWSIPEVCTDKERAAYVMEALGSASYRTVQPEIYDSIKYRGSDEAINVDMFNIIMESRVYDLGRMFHNSFEDWNYAPVMLFRVRLYTYTGEYVGWSSMWGHYQSLVQGDIDKINTGFGY